MLKKIIKTSALLILTIALLLGTVACRSPLGNGYVSKSEMDHAEMKQAVLDAYAVNDTFSDVRYTYSFFLDMDLPDGTHYRLGTENVFNITGHGTENVRIHRNNTFYGSDNSKKTEDFYLNSGKIYTARFGQSYKSSITEQGFMSYTEYSDISVNVAYFSPDNFSSAARYKLFGSRYEIVFTGANEYIESGIIAFIGLDQESYVYTVRDTMLTATVEKDGSLSENRLSFYVDYYDPELPSVVLTYEGNFTYTLNATSDITVPDHDKSVMYKEIDNIELLSSVTSKGYEVLFSLPNIDATFEKYVKVTDASNDSHVMDSRAHITAKYIDGAFRYGSIDHSYFSTKSLVNVTNGIFIDVAGYHERSYDHVQGKRGTDIDTTELKRSESDLRQIIATTLSTEVLFEDEISSVNVKEETDTAITFTVRFNNYSARIFASYLIDHFTDKSSTSDLSGQAFTILKSDIEITVRKSDGCILRQSIDFKAELYGTGNYVGSITVEGKIVMNVNSTASGLTLLVPTDFEAAINDSGSTPT